MERSGPLRAAERGTLAHWRQGGAVSLWRYAENTRHFDGWHITADADGGHSLLTLIDLLVEANDVALYRTLTVMHPTDAILRVPNNRDVPAIAPAKWRLRCSQVPEDWSLVEDGDGLECILGRVWMAKLRTSIEAMLGGDGDFAIVLAQGPLRVLQRLWYWWWPKPPA